MGTWVLAQEKIDLGKLSAEISDLGGHITTHLADIKDEGIENIKKASPEEVKAVLDSADTKLMETKDAIYSQIETMMEDVFAKYSSMSTKLHQAVGKDQTGGEQHGKES
jgi:hypothetical protein